MFVITNYQLLTILNAYESIYDADIKKVITFTICLFVPDNLWTGWINFDVTFTGR